LLRIEDVGDMTPGGGVPVTFRDGRKAYLPYDDCEWIPGAVVVPLWLARKMVSHRGTETQRGNQNK